MFIFYKKLEWIWMKTIFPVADRVRWKSAAHNTFLLLDREC